MFEEVTPCESVPILAEAERVVVGVSAEVAPSLGALTFVDDLAVHLGGPSPRFQAWCTAMWWWGDTPYPAWSPSFLRAGTCAAGWCSAPNRSERAGRTVEVLLGLHRRLDGDWTLAALSTASVARLGLLREGEEPPSIVVLRDHQHPAAIRGPVDHEAWSPGDVAALIRARVAPW